jgi:hypothetical protein
MSVPAKPGYLADIYVYPPFNAESYIIGSYNSTYYFAKNGTTGNYDHLTTNFVTMIELLTQTSVDIQFMPGDYYLSSQIDLVNIQGIVLSGLGHQTVFHWDPTVIINNNYSMIKVDNTAINVTIKNIIFDGRICQSSIWDFGIITRSTNTVLDNLDMYNFTLCVGFEHGANNGIVKNSIFHDCLGSTLLGSGIFVNNASNIQIVGNTGYNLWEPLIDCFQAAHDVLINNNVAYDCVGGGINLEFWYEAPYTADNASDYRISITNNLIQSSGYNGNGNFGNTSSATGGYGGITIQKAKDVIISGNVIHDCGRGILIANYRGMAYPYANGLGGSSMVTIANNHVYRNNFAVSSNGEGIYLDNVYLATVSNNLIEANFGDGMFINDSSQYLTIIGNTFKSNGIGMNNLYSQLHIKHPTGHQNTYLTIAHNTFEGAEPTLNRAKYNIFDDNPNGLNEYSIFSDNIAENALTANMFFSSDPSSVNVAVLNSYNGSVYIASLGSAYPIGVTPASYIVDVSGSSYRMINGSTNQVDFISTNASEVINFAYGNMTSTHGTVFVKAGTYSLSAPILFNGSGWGVNRAQYGLIGEGRESTVFVPASYVDAIQIQNDACVVLRDFSIQVPTGNSGHGIAAYDTGYGGPSTDMGIFDNIFIYGCSAGKWGIYLESPDFMTLGNLFVETFGAGVICFNQTNNVYSWGDTSFVGNNYFDVGSDNAICIYITRSPSGVTKKMNLIVNKDFMALQGTHANDTGIWVSYGYSLAFSGVTYQGLALGIYADSCTGSVFTGDQQYNSVNMTVQTTANSNSLIFKDFNWGPAVWVNHTAFIDGCTNTDLPNIYQLWYISNGSYNVDNSVAAGTIVRDIYFDTGTTHDGFTIT